LDNVKTKILNLWRRVDRPGVDELIEFLETSDFFTAPCSTQYHLAKPGGLAEHSLNVFNLLQEKCMSFIATDISGNGKFKFPKIPNESIIICGLGHDLCKVNCYGKEAKWRKDANNRWESYEAYVVKDQLPLGHGEKSVSILQDFIPLTKVEKLAIRWHMACWDAGIHFNYPSGYAYKEAVKVHPLVMLLFTADLEASNIIEREE
jgi:hypothetical protein